MDDKKQSKAEFEHPLVALSEQVAKLEATEARQLALENARLFEETERRRREAESLAEVGRLLSESLDPEEVCQRIVNSVLTLLDVEAASLYRLESGSGDMVMLAASGDVWSTLGQNTVIPKGCGLAGLAVAERQPVATPNLLTDSRVIYTPELRARMEQAPFRAGLVVLLQVQDRVIGALGVGDRAGRIFTKEEMQLAQVFANQAAIALNNARLFGESEARRRAAEALFDIAQAFSWSLELKYILKAIAQRTAQAVGAERCSIILWRAGRVVPVMSQFADGHTDSELWASFKALGLRRVEEVPPYAEVGRTKQPIVIEDTASSSLSLGWLEVFGTRAVLVVPLIHQDEVIGVLILDRTKEPYAWPQGQIALAMTIASHATLAVENARLYEDVRATRDFLQSIAENSADAIITTNVQARISYVSPGAEEMLGYPAEHVLGRRVREYFRSGLDEIRAVGRRLRAEGRIRNYETAVGALDGRRLHLNSSLSLLRDVSGTVVGTLAIVRDTTERKKAEITLRQHAERLRALREIDQAILRAQLPETIAQAALRHMRWLVPCDRASITLFDVGTNSCTVLAADVSADSRVSAGARFPLEAVPSIEELQQGKILVVDDILPLSELPRVIQILKEEGLRSYIIIPLTSQGNLIGALNLGANLPGAFTLEHVDVAGEVADSLAVAIQNARLFEQVRATNERLQILSRRLVEVQEAERRHVARELHDEIGQLLTGLKLTLERRSRRPVNIATQGDDRAEALVNELIAKVRELSLDLRQPILDDLGLLPALLWHFERCMVETNVHVTFQQRGLEGQHFRPEVETAAYRIVQEALTNVARHARTKEAKVHLWTDQHALCIQVEDDGLGFDPETIQASQMCHGLAGMRERASLLGGHLTLSSAPGAGTRVAAELPLGDTVESGGKERQMGHE